MKKTRIAILVMMLIAAACVLFGSFSLSIGGMFTITYRYLDAVFEGKDNSWFFEVRMQMRLILCSALIIAVLVWFKKRWTEAVCAIACLLPSVCLIVLRIVGNRMSFGFDNVYDALMFLFPLGAAALCLNLLRTHPQEDWGALTATELPRAPESEKGH